jgi:hypothetical protein
LRFEGKIRNQDFETWGVKGKFGVESLSLEGKFGSEILKIGVVRELGIETSNIDVSSGNSESRT